MNVKNRTIFSEDNLKIMRGIETESIDLIYLDPPFNSKHDYSAPIGSKAAGAEFKDTWTFNDIDESWWAEIEEVNEGLYEILKSSGIVGGKSVKSYLIYMAIRIIEMHRILKKTGTLYLHCDQTMSHYLKLVLDSIFNRDNFKNNLVWCYKTRHFSKKYWGKKHDDILVYTKSDKFTFNWNDPKIIQSYSESTIAKYKLKDEKGVYRLCGRGIKDSPIKSAKDVDPKWEKTNPELVVRNYLGNGYPPSDYLYIDIINQVAKERVGYPTQKPLELLERIISAASNVEDIVLDPFCGCATACLAAEKLKRKWIGIDISPLAYKLVKVRLKNESALDRFTDKEYDWNVIQRTDIPKRESVQSKDIKYKLYGRQEGNCNGCGQHFPFKIMEKDHIIPVSKGGQNDDDNFQLLCGHCNKVKGNRLDNNQLKVKLKSQGFFLRT